MNRTAPGEPLERLHDLPAPAKLNLFLHITGRRADGYHLLQSVFMLIDWCDTLHLDLRRDGVINRVDKQPGLLPEVDLTLKAALILQERTGCKLGAQITLDKSIPAEAGMGGGSSDAATCLLGLNRLWGLNLPRGELAAIGLQLGADVPFFIGGRNAWIEGVGERITPIRLPSARFVVVKPAAGVSTQRIFAAQELKRDTKTAILQGFVANDCAGTPCLDLQKILDFGQNDLQAVAQMLCPEVEQCMRWLDGQGLQGRMTGSGSAVFAHVQHPRKRVSAPDSWTVRECGNMDAHPLLDWCAG